MVITVTALRILSLVYDEVVVCHTIDTHVHDGVIPHRDSDWAITAGLMAVVVILDMQVVILACLLFVLLAWLARAHSLVLIACGCGCYGITIAVGVLLAGDRGRTSDHIFVSLVLVCWDSMLIWFIIFTLSVFIVTSVVLTHAIARFDINLGCG